MLNKLNKKIKLLNNLSLKNFKIESFKNKIKIITEKKEESSLK